MADGIFDSISNFLGSDTFSNIVNVGAAGYDIYQGVQAAGAQQRYLGQLGSSLGAQAAFTEEQRKRMAKLLYPIEEAQAKYALEDIEATRGLSEAQRDFAIGQGLADIEQQKLLQPIFRETEQSLIGRLAEGEDVLASRLRGQATADVQQAYGRSRAQQARDLARYGLRPTSGAFAQQQRLLTQGQALAEAGARTQASRQAEDVALSRQAQALNYRRGLPLPQQQYTPTTTPSAIAAGLAGTTGAFGSAAQQAGQQAQASMAGAAYSLAQPGQRAQTNRLLSRLG